MELSDLMIGDWVFNKHHKKNIQITPYDFFTHGHLPSGKQYLLNVPEIVSGRDLEPIPLTPEILEKNGFERRDDLVVDDNFLPFILERLDTDECFEIVVYWRDSYCNGAADAFNEVSWNEYWKLHILSGPSLYEYETGNCIYVHELQHALKLCWIKKEIEL